MTPEIHRALIAFDLSGVPRVLATDSRYIAGDAEEFRTTDADELGIVSARDVGPGLSLWEGTGAVRDGVCEYKGTLRSIVNMVEAIELFRMAPPEPEFPDDDRESPGA